MFLQNRWWIVAASTLGLMVGSGSINTFGVAVFLRPVSEDLGLGRGTFSLGMMLANAMNGFAAPFIGIVVDRFGSRKILLPGAVMFSLTIAAMSTLQGSQLMPFLGLFALAGLIGSTQSMVPYGRLISALFDRDRGLALGMSFSGVGLGVAIIPPLASWFIELYGWRAAYYGLAATIFVLAFIPVLLLVRELPAARDSQAANGSNAVGLTLKEALGQWQFWLMMLGFFIAAGTTTGPLTHAAAMLADRGVTVAVTSAAISSAGLAMIIGRLICGYLLDRFHGPYIASAYFIVAGFGVALLGHDVPIWGALLGIVMCGANMGAVVGIEAFFVGRYFGLKAFGEIFGVVFGVHLIGNGIGAFLSGLSFDLFGSYELVLTFWEALLVAVAMTFTVLGPYRFVVRAGAARPAVVPRDSSNSTSRAEAARNEL